MKKRTMGFARGATAGMLAGVAVTAIGAKMVKDNKHLKHNADKAMQAVGGMLTDVQTAFKG